MYSAFLLENLFFDFVGKFLVLLLYLCKINFVKILNIVDFFSDLYYTVK